MAETIFSRIIRKEIPADIVYEDEDVLAFRDINPQAPVHILVIPKLEIPGVMEINGAEHARVLGRLFDAVKTVAEIENLPKSGFRVVINNGADAGQAVEHLHLHVLGGRKLNWPPG